MKNPSKFVETHGIRELTQCRICHSAKLEKFLSLGTTPLANSFLKQEQLNEPEPYYPLDVCFCQKCGLVQLAQVVDPGIMFKEYAYQTGASAPMKEHFAKLAAATIQKFHISNSSLILDIGSNDGTLLECFRVNDMRVLGIEPATNIAKLSSSKGIETINDFFNANLANKIVSNVGKPHVILATNVFAHVDNLDDFVTGVSTLLADNGVFTIEAPYLLDMIANVEFDTIYHEHLSYFNLHPLVTFFNKFGMDIVDVERIGVHGGSVCINVQKFPNPIGKSVTEMLNRERTAKMDSLATYTDFAKRVDKIRDSLVAQLEILKEKGATIAAYGATAKGNTLLNYCGISTDILDYVSDTTPFKQGRYTPGTHIPVFPESHFHDCPPDYTLLLAWNYADEILAKEREYRQRGGKFILPIPEPRIV